MNNQNIINLFVPSFSIRLYIISYLCPSKSTIFSSGSQELYYLPYPFHCTQHSFFPFLVRVHDTPLITYDYLNPLSRSTPISTSCGIGNGMSGSFQDIFFWLLGVVLIQFGYKQQSRGRFIEQIMLTIMAQCMTAHSFMAVFLVSKNFYQNGATFVTIWQIQFSYFLYFLFRRLYPSDKSNFNSIQRLYAHHTNQRL